MNREQLAVMFLVDPSPKKIREVIYKLNDEIESLIGHYDGLTTIIRELNSEIEDLKEELEKKWTNSKSFPPR